MVYWPREGHGMSATPARRGRPVWAAGVIAAALAVSLGACSGSSPSAAGPTTPVNVNGPQVNDSADGVHLTLPAGWKPIPLGNRSGASLTAVVHDQSEVNELEQQIRLGQTRGMRVFALEPRAGGPPGSLNVSITLAQSSTLDSLQNQLQLSAGQLATDQPAFERLTLPVGPALRIHYHLPDGDSTTQYYVINGARAYVLTVTTGDPSPDLRVYDAVARTLRVAGGSA